MLADLHTHTTASDGKLAASELLSAASAAGVTLLAITDHDTVAAYSGLDTCRHANLNVVAGVEFSSWWERTGIHILGLNIDLASPAITAACRHQGQARDDRARAIGERLRKRGIGNAYEGAAAYAGGGAIGRPHFARHLVAVGAAVDPADAFRKFLGGRHEAGGFDHWAPLAAIIAWIRDAGGTAVLAHPAKYKLTNGRLNALLTAFRVAGGQGLEVISGQQTPDQTRHLSALARAHDLAASAGSDFHQSGLPWATLGKVAPLAADLRPVWDLW